jgi:DNA-binding transcriptional ArsR family regulator
VKSTRSAAAKDEQQLDAIFSALSDRTRRRILARLCLGPASVGELAEPFSISLPAVSKHLRILERARLLRRERDGWYHDCHLVGQPLETASRFLERYRSFWDETLAALARHVEERPVVKRRRGRTKGQRQP